MKRNQFDKMKTRKLKYYKPRNLRKKSLGEVFLKRTLLLLLLPITLVILLICRQSERMAEEFFFRRIYRPISIGYSRITGKIPFSIGEIGLYLLILLGIGLFIHGIRRLVQSKGERGRLFGRYVLNIACTICVVFFVETILCGVNYYRHSFTYYSGLEVRDSSEDELYVVCDDLAQNAGRLRAQVPYEDKEGVFKLSTSNRETARKANAAVESLADVYPILGGWNTMSKSVLLSRQMSYTETTGIFCAFTMEANVNTDIAQYSIPYTMIHELSHLRGFMREEEANFIAYLACIESDDVELQYCGTMLALIHCGNALYHQNPDRYAQLRATYSEAVLRDLAANNRYWAKYEDTVVSKVSDKVNDTYLKLNAQSDGVKSYGRVVDLVLAYYRNK